jgi:mannose-6-phosphate isomerase-like protein (cupin superfamily)
MDKTNLKDFTKGWIVGNFNPTLLDTNDFEVAIKRYNAGDYENKHHHKIATEITVIVEGEVEMNGIKYVKDDIITIQPNEATDFKCITDVITVVVKTPSANDDKYID